VAIQARETRKGERRVVVRFDDDEIAEGRTADLDRDRPQFMLHIDSWADNSRAAIVPLASVKRIVLERDRVTAPIPDDVVHKVALHFWDGEVMPGLLRAVPHRQRHGMVLELVSPQAGCAEVLALPYHALKAVFFLRSWDTRQPQSPRDAGRARSALSRHEAPLIDLLGEIRGLRGLRHRGEISAVEHERRRSQVLNRI
jgi:hypothetical protein